MNLLDIAFYEEPDDLSADLILQRHKGTWEHYLHFDTSIHITIIKFCRFKDERRLGNMHFIFCPLPSGVQLLFFLRTLKKERGPEVVLTHSLQFPFSSYLLKKVFGPTTKLMLQLHGDKPQGSFLKSRLQRFVYFRNFSYLITGAGQLLPFYKMGILSTQGPVFELMEGSSSFARKAPHKNSTSIISLLSVSRLIAGKDLKTLIEAMALLQKKNFLFHLTLIAGTTELKESLETLITRLKLDGKIKLLSKISHAEMEAHYQQADIFISCSLHEGSGWSLCEALSCGLATVVTAIPAHCYMTEEGRTGGMFEPGDVRGLADEIVRVSTQLDSYSDEALQVFKTRLSFEAIARRLQEIILGQL